MKTYESRGKTGGYTSLTVLALAAVVLVSFTQPRLASAQTPVSACDTTLEAPGRYVLTGDLNCPDNAILIIGSQVDFDLNGFTLTGQGVGAGIDFCDPARPTSGVRISRGQVVGFENGINVCAATGARIAWMTVSQNLNVGISLGATNSGVSNSIIAGNHITGNGGHGIHGTACNNNQFIANDASNNGGHGFRLFECQDNRLALNNASDNGSNGIAVIEGTGYEIVDNRANGNDGTGIGLRGLNLENNTLKFNETNDNGQLGISIDGARNFIQRNTSRNNVIFDMDDERAAFPDCPNNWKRNLFDTDNEGDGPGVGCIR